MLPAGNRSITAVPAGLRLGGGATIQIDDIVVS
jgi:hypothetical protein